MTLCIISYFREGMSESDWKKLFADILDLRNKVYQCVSTARCFEVLGQD